MKIRTKLIALTVLILGLTMQPSRLVHAQIPNPQDMDILDFFMMYIGGVVEKDKELGPIVNCDPEKTITVPLYCGDGFGGSGSFVNNYYVIFIDDNMEPESLSPTFGEKNVELNKSHCIADRISITETTQDYKFLPDDLKEGNLIIPAGKKAVFYIVRVHNGAGKIDIKLNPTCRRNLNAQ